MAYERAVESQGGEEGVKTHSRSELPRVLVEVVHIVVARSTLKGQGHSRVEAELLGGSRSKLGLIKGVSRFVGFRNASRGGAGGQGDREQREDSEESREHCKVEYWWW